MVYGLFIRERGTFINNDLKASLFSGTKLVPNPDPRVFWLKVYVGDKDTTKNLTAVNITDNHLNITKIKDLCM